MVPYLVSQRICGTARLLGGPNSPEGEKVRECQRSLTTGGRRTGDGRIVGEEEEGRVFHQVEKGVVLDTRIQIDTELNIMETMPGGLRGEVVAQLEPILLHILRSG